MKTKLTIVLLTMATLLCSCKHKHTCDDVVKPANLKPIDWQGWNDAYTVGYTFYDNEENACYDYDGDTILCYGHIAQYLYDDYPSLKPDNIYLESGHMQQGVHIDFGFLYDQNSSERDSLINLLNSSNYSDTCFVKGVFKVSYYHIITTSKDCKYSYPGITVCRIEDIWFKR